MPAGAPPGSERRPRAATHLQADAARQQGLTGVAERFSDKSQRIHEDVERIHDLIVNGRALEPVSEEDNVTS